MNTLQVIKTIIEVMNWKDYEEITKYIYETLGKETGVKIVGYGNTCKVKGKSSVYHQIDVLTCHSDGIHNYQTAIECKYWEKKINKDIVMKMTAIIEDTDIHKGVIVSKKGYTKDGLSFAKQKNIGLVELREIEERDWKEQGKKLKFKVAKVNLKNKIERRRPEILSVEIDDKAKNLKSKEINPYQLTVRLKSGIEIPFKNYLMDFKKMLHEEKSDKIIKEYFELKEADLINTVTKEVTQINGFSFTGKLTITNLDFEQKLEIVDEVWMIMKSLFENTFFYLSKSGMIKRENNNFDK